MNIVSPIEFDNHKYAGINYEISRFTNIDLGSVRSVYINSVPYFCLIDICNVLGLNVDKASTNIRNRIDYMNSIPNPYNKRVGVNSMNYYYLPVQYQSGIKRDGSPALQIIDTLFVSEPALYYIIFNSRKPNAIAFQNWVYAEILPRMRQLGRNESIESLQNKINELELKAETLEASRESLINLIIEGGIL